MPPTRSDAARTALLYGTIAIVMTAPLVARIGSSLPAGSDNLYVAWSLAWVAHAALHAPLRMLDGNIFYPAGDALAFSDPNVSSGLMLAPLAFAFGNPAILINVLFVGSFVLCGLATAHFVRRGGGESRAALAAGALFAFSPLRFSHLDHVQLYACWWIPLALASFDRYLREGRRADAWATAVSIVLQAYTSIYLVVFQLTALALFLAMAMLAGRARPSWRTILLEPVLPALFVGLACAPLAAAYFTASRTWGVTRTIAENAYYSASPTAWLSAAPNNVLWGGILERFADPAAPWEKFLFPGLLTSLLAAIGLARERRAFPVMFGVALFVLCAVLSLGPFATIAGHPLRLPYALGFAWFPPLHALRVPARWALLASLGLALAAAAGAARLPRPMFWPVILLAVAEAWVSPFPLAALPNAGGVPPVYGFLAGSGSGPLVELPLATSSVDRYRLEAPRVYWSTLHWRPIANGYSGYTPAPYRELAQLLEGGPSPDALDVLAAWHLTTVVVHLDEMEPAQRAAWETAGGPQELQEVFRDDRTRVYRLSRTVRPFTPVSATLEEPTTLVARARQSLPLVFAPVPRVVAVAPHEIGWHSGRARWQSSDRAPVDGWVRYFCPPVIPSRLPAQRLFIEPPAATGRYHLDLAGRCFDLTAAVTVSAAAPRP